MDERDIEFDRMLIQRIAEVFVKVRKENREVKKENVDNKKDDKTIPL